MAQSECWFVECPKRAHWRFLQLLNKGSILWFSFSVALLQQFHQRERHVALVIDIRKLYIGVTFSILPLATFQYSYSLRLYSMLEFLTQWFLSGACSWKQKVQCWHLVQSVQIIFLTLQLDWTSSARTRTINVWKTRRTTTNPIPPLKGSWQGESRSSWSSFLWSIFTSFQNSFKIISKHHWTKQNQIRLVEYSCSEVSGLSEVPRFVRKIIS